MQSAVKSTALFFMRRVGGYPAHASNQPSHNMEQSWFKRVKVHSRAF